MRRRGEQCGRPHLGMSSKRAEGACRAASAPLRAWQSTSHAKETWEREAVACELGTISVRICVFCVSVLACHAVDDDSVHCCNKVVCTHECIIVTLLLAHQP